MASIPFTIRQHGFHNLGAPGAFTGFQIVVQSPYYRGVWLSLIEGIDVIVDGESFGADRTRFQLGERTYTWAEMETMGDTLWPWLESATVLVDKPGGLMPGVHDVSVVIKIRISYMPFNPVGHFASTKLVLMPTAAECAELPKPRLAASLYSYNGDLQAGTMTLEQCLGDLADMGAEGFEFLPEAIVPDYPNPSEAWLKQWFAWLEKYRLTPIAVDGSCDTKLYKNRKLSVQEIADLIITDLKLAHRLGCKGYRGMGSSWPAALGVSGNVSVKSEWTTGITPFEIYDKVLPTAEKLDVRIGEELHIPFLIKSEWLHQTIEYVNKRGTHHLGFVPDMSIFVRRPPKSLDTEQFVQRGLARNVVDYILQAREQIMPEDQAKAKVQEMGGGTPALQLTAMIYHLSYSTRERNEPEQLKELIPYIVHIHGKCYDIAEDLSDEKSIPYSEIVPVLAHGGYTGFISTEYEGERAAYAASQQVRRQQLMIRQQWAKALHAGAASF